MPLERLQGLREILVVVVRREGIMLAVLERQRNEVVGVASADTYAVCCRLHRTELIIFNCYLDEVLLDVHELKHCCGTMPTKLHALDHGQVVLDE